MTPLRSLFFTLGLFTAAVTAHADDPDSTARFADHLYLKGEFSRAMNEYDRAAFLSATNTDTSVLELRMALCQMNLQKWEDAARLLQDTRERHQGQPGERSAMLLLADTRVQGRTFGQALNVLSDFGSRFTDDPHLDDVRIQQGICQLRFSRHDEAAAAFASVPSNSPLHNTAAQLQQSIPEHRDLPRKSPVTAGILSACLPGAGQLYTERRGDALTSFLINGVVIGVCVAAYKNDEEVLGGFLAFFESTWYMGNIYNAVNNAHKFNADRESRFFQKISIEYGGFDRIRNEFAPSIGIKASF